MEQPNFVEVTVTPREREKVVYVKNIVDGLVKVAHAFDEHRTQEFGLKQVALDRKINWQQIGNYVAPELVLVLVTSPDNHKDRFKGVWDYPKYLIITSSGSLIDLDEHYVLNTTESRQRAKSDSVAAINSLRGTLNSFDARKRGNLMRHLEILEKALVPKG